MRDFDKIAADLLEADEHKKDCKAQLSDATYRLDELIKERNDWIEANNRKGQQRQKRA